MPLWEQYLRFIAGIFTGDLGTSLEYRLPVADIIAQRLPATLALGAAGFTAAIVIAIPLGVVVAVATRRGRRRGLELGFTSTSVVLGAIPDFLIGVALVWVFAVSLDWLPVAGANSPESYVLPVVALAVGPAVVLARIVRVELLATLDTDFVRTARAKRLMPRRVVFRQALPSALTASLTIGGLLLGSMIASTVLVENVFAWPGIGSTVVSSVIARDYPVALALTLLLGTITLVVNLVVDVLLALIDPRSIIREH